MADETIQQTTAPAETPASATDARERRHAQLLSDSTELFGYTIPLPFYTVVYVTLAVVTALEIGISSLPHSILTTIVLIVTSLTKAILVILFFMHLRDDSRIFVVALLLPVFIALLASIFLLSVPPGNY